MDYEAAEDVYRQLGQSVVGAIDGDWDAARLVCEIEDEESGSLYGVYTYTEGGAVRAGQFDADHDAYLLFRELRAATEHPDHGPWTTATFKLDRDLRFSVDFGYDPLDEDEAPWDRAERVEREMLSE